MRKRLQVRLDDAELREIQHAAKRSGVTVAAWVREALRTARLNQETAVQRKLEVVRLAIAHAFSTADIGRMIEETETDAGIQRR